jgi:hypothetical protein
MSWARWEDWLYDGGFCTRIYQGIGGFRVPE